MKKKNNLYSNNKELVTKIHKTNSENAFLPLQTK